MATRRTPAPPVAEQPQEYGPVDRAERFRFFFDKVAPWVNKGSVYGFPLHEELAEPTIVEYESAICALTAVPIGTVLGLTSGKRGHLFYFHPSFNVVDVGVLGDGEVTGGAIVATRDDVVVGGWRGASGGLFRHNARHELGTGQEDFYSRKAPIEFLPLPAGEGILALTHDAPAGVTYALTTRNRILSLKEGAKRPAVEARTDARLAPVLVRLADGQLLGACEEGQLWQYEPGAKQIRRTGLFVPCERGKRYVAGVQSLLVTASGRVYGGTATDGFFFSFDPQRQRLVNLGKPHRQSFIKCLTEGHEGLIYGVVEEPKGLAHLFTFDPEERAFEDLGLLSAFIPIQWTPNSLGALCTGIHGEIYAGESDTISHLFVYHPPVVRRRARSSDTQ